MSAHDVERDSRGAPRHEAEQSGGGPCQGSRVGGEERLDEEVSAVGRVAEATEGHREASFVLSVAPFVGEDRELLELSGGDLGLVTDADRVAETGQLGHGPLDLRQRGEREVLRVEDGLVADVEDFEAGIVIGLSALLRGGEDGRHPAEGLGVRDEGPRGRRPLLRRSDRVAGDEADAGVDLVGDDAVVGEERRTVAAGAEVAE